MHDTAKLYIVTRRDISPGLQAAQSVHAAFEFADTHPGITKGWMNISNYICVLAVASELELKALAKRAAELNIRKAEFYEPDLGGEMTAIAIEPSLASERLVSEYDLALKEYQKAFMYY